MKILCVGEAPTINSGFANVFREINDHWIEKGHEVRQLGWCHGKDRKNPYPYKIYPVLSPIGYENYYGVNIFDGIIDEYKPDIVFSLADVYMVNWMPNMRTRKKFKWILYTPIDSAPIPRVWRPTLENADVVVTYSKFAHNSLLEYQANFRAEPQMIYHGYNPEQFYRLTDDEIQTVKHNNRLEDKFIYTFVGTNSTRKHPERLLWIWSEFRKGKDDVVLLMHTKPSDERQGFHLKEMLYEHDMLGDDVVFVQGANPINGVPIEHVNKLYNMSDVMVSAASCEGFGLPLLEAAACGTPSIGVDYSSIPELIKGHGELVKPITYYQHKPLCQNRPLVDIDDFCEKMEKLYHNDELLAKYEKKCLTFAKKFTWDKIFPKFDAILDFVQNEAILDTTVTAAVQDYLEV